MSDFKDEMKKALRTLGLFGPYEQAEEMSRLGADYGKMMNETEPCVCGHGKPFHFFDRCSPELAASYKARGFPDGACHHAFAHETFPAKCGCVMYQKKE